MPIIEAPDLPLPGHGNTAERFRRLTALGRADLVTDLSSLATTHTHQPTHPAV